MQSLRREKVLRIFKLNTGQDDHAIMFSDDYLNQVVCLIFYIHLVGYIKYRFFFQGVSSMKLMRTVKSKFLLHVICV